MSYPTELLSPFPAEPGDSAENQRLLLVRPYTKKPTVSIPLSQRALPPPWMICGTGPTSTMDWCGLLTWQRSMSTVWFSSLPGTKMLVLGRLLGLVQWVTLSRRWSVSSMSGGIWNLTSVIHPGCYLRWTVPGSSTNDFSSVTQVWDVLDLCGGERGWIVYHNNQRLQHQKVMVHQGDFFACYERCDGNPQLLADRPGTDVAQGWVMRRCLYLVKRLDPPPLRPQSVMLQTVPQLMPPLLSKTQGTLCSSLRRGGRRRRDDRSVSFNLWFSIGRWRNTECLRNPERLKGVLQSHPVNRSELHGSLPQFRIDISATSYHVVVHGYMHLLFPWIGRVVFLSIGMKGVCLAMVQVLGRLNPFPVRTQRRGAPASLVVFSCRSEFGSCLLWCRPLVMTNTSVSLPLNLLWRMPTWSQVVLHFRPRKWYARNWGRVWPDCQPILRVLLVLRVWISSSFLTDYKLTFQVTLMEDEVLIPVQGLSQGTLVPDSEIQHL